MPTIAPWLSVRNGSEALEYYRAAFGAVELERLDDEGGGVAVARLSVGDADFWIQTDAASSPDPVRANSVRMILTVDDPDAVFASAVSAGATVIAPITEGHGWRVGRVLDPHGHQWEIGRPVAR